MEKESGERWDKINFPGANPPDPWVQWPRSEHSRKLDRGPGLELGGEKAAAPDLWETNPGN